MNNSRLADIILRGAEDSGLILPKQAGLLFQTYYDFLGERGKRVNLTAIEGEVDVARLHFLDSLALLKTRGFSGARVIDVGSGAGFPGVPLKIAEPSIELTLLDASGKRVAFLTELCSKLGIRADCVHERAEEAARRHDMRESYDIALSRAVAELSVLCELCLPFVRPGGDFIAMKGAGSDNEVIDARNAIETLCAELVDCVDYAVPGTDVIHRAVIIRKTGETPEKYPRRFARISSRPL